MEDLCSAITLSPISFAFFILALTKISFSLYNLVSIDSISSLVFFAAAISVSLASLFVSKLR